MRGRPLPKAQPDPTYRDRPESGIEWLRRIVALADSTRESVWDGLSIEETVSIAVACLRSGWDVYPDQLSYEQLCDARRGMSPDFWDGEATEPLRVNRTQAPMGLEFVRDSGAEIYDGRTWLDVTKGRGE